MTERVFARTELDGRLLVGIERTNGFQRVAAQADVSRLAIEAAGFPLLDYLEGELRAELDEHPLEPIPSIEVTITRAQLHR